MRHVDLAASAAQTSPDKVAIRAGGRYLSYRALDQRIDRLGGALHAAGLAVGDRVGLLAGNVLEYPEIQGVGIRWGYVLVPLNNRLTAPELGYLLRDAQVSVLIVGAPEHGLAVSTIALLDDPPEVWHLGSASSPAYDDIIGSAAAMAGPGPDGPEVAVSITYTSGTTGPPKGAVLNRSAMSARILSAVAEMNIARNDVWLQVLPMFHIASGPPYACLARGATVVLLDRFTPHGAVESLLQWQCTMTVLVPTMIEMLLEHVSTNPVRLEKLRFLGYGAAPIDAALLEAMMGAFDCEFQQWYGQTELGGVTALHHVDHNIGDAIALSSVGRPMVGYEVAIRDEAGAAVLTGQVGEITCRGPAAMSGYWNRPDTTVANVDTWHCTGDIGYFDERGFLHLIDRRNDMIITGGENVYPGEVESVLAGAADVADVVVCGVPDARWGQLVAAMYVGEAAVDDLIAHCASLLAKYKVPRLWLRTAGIPRNAMGKVVRPAVADTMSRALIDGRAVRH